MKLVNFFLISSIFLLLTLVFLHPISAITQDLGRHLLTGKIIWETKAIPLTNLYSYTYPDFPFINHHWLSEVIFYFINSLTGFNGLLIFTIIIVIIAFSLIFLYSPNRNLSSLSFLRKQESTQIEHGSRIKCGMTEKSIISFLSLGILLERTDVRPEIFSFLFLSLFITILYKNRQHFTRWVFLLPFLELLWVNIHIYFILGVVVLGFFLIDTIFSLLTQRENKTFSFNTLMSIGNLMKSNRFLAEQVLNKKILMSGSSNLLILFLIFVTTTLTTLLNPNGLAGTLYPLKVFQNYGYSIEENQNIFFLWSYSHKPTIIFFAISTITLFSTLLINLKKTKLIDWFLAIFFTILGTVAIRNFPLFVFATFIPFTQNLSTLFSKIQPSHRTDTYKKITLLILFIVILWGMFSISSTRVIGFGVEKGAENAVDFFINENIKGPVFNNFDIGSYLEYRLYPKEKVFVDGRPEAYPSDFFQKTYIPMQQSLDLFKQITNRYNFNSIFFSHTDQTPWAQEFLKQIMQEKTWKMVYLDDYVVILVRDNAQNKKIINKYLVTDRNFQLTDVQRTNLLSLYRLANFLSILNWIDQQENIYQAVLTINPNSCPALYNLSQILSQKQSPLSSVFIQKFSLNCK